MAPASSTLVPIQNVGHGDLVLFFSTNNIGRQFRLPSTRIAFDADALAFLVTYGLTPGGPTLRFDRKIKWDDFAPAVHACSS